MEPIKLTATVTFEPPLNEEAADEFISALPDEIQHFIESSLERDGFNGQVEVSLLS